MVNAILAGAAFSASTTGVLTYRTGGQLDQSNARQLTWVDRAGKALGAIGQPGVYRNPALSPDGARVAVNALDAQGRTQDLWLVELARGVASRFTFDPGNDIYPVWSPDGSRIVFGSDRDSGVYHLYQKRADGVGIEEPVVKSSLNMLPHDFSPDGRFLVYRTLVNGRSQIGIVPLVGEQTLRLFDPSPFIQTSSQVSPDGRWLAYNADESGRYRGLRAELSGAGWRQVADLEGRRLVPAMAAGWSRAVLLRQRRAAHGRPCQERHEARRG